MHPQHIDELCVRHKASQVAVYGSFPFMGTFKLSSKFAVDDHNFTDFIPPGTITYPLYRQQFYVSPPLTMGSHQLTIRNEGVQFYIDYIVLTVDDTSAPASNPSTSHMESSEVPTAAVLTPVQSTSRTSVPQTHLSAGSTVQPSSGVDVLTKSSTETLTYEGGSSAISATSSMPPLATTSNTDNESRSDPPSTKRSEYAGIASGVAVLLLIVVMGSYLWRRHRGGTSPAAHVVPFGQNSICNVAVGCSPVLSSTPFDESRHSKGRQDRLVRRR